LPAGVSWYRPHIEPYLCHAGARPTPSSRR
jgi:hypothetical protein